MITVRLFGMTKSLARNLSELSLELNGARQVKDLVALLEAQYPQIGELIHNEYDVRKGLMTVVRIQLAGDELCIVLFDVTDLRVFHQLIPLIHFHAK